MIIEHGRRIRACLKQPEFAPVSVPAQIAVLLALTAELFERIPFDQMTVAEQAVRTAAADIPEEISARFETADKLSEEDRTTIIEIARHSLIRFQPKPGSKPEFTDEPISDAGIKPKPNPATTPKPKVEAEAEEKS